MMRTRSSCWTTSLRLMTSLVRSWRNISVHVYTAIVYTMDCCFTAQSTTTLIALSCRTIMS
ncbi:hypothetical protein PF010_g32034 [Phytophthora fragariae]|uniref:Uncharacterized protein n=2 Tax=Phytophthora TaxID=4783 RepID=A0A6A3PE56_9STRA|nr:hypothetical protein PF003_g11848 [Phytophthora fragariae]KAE8957157.1 hypothetical protein PR002_g31259 [Phytophthora rubi]KAE8957296.1 hypothetical protein PF011_g31196 [Phytophthora fragariae]KAE9055267.1 hypothetical protein PF006_g33011 [Phytophthora fragariae]KAE9055745.1 hypothetical protein PF010_g32034 [Phytophthora fragariae]